MPIWRHFWYLQALHLLRLSGVRMHWPPKKHLYFSALVMLRLKKPYRGSMVMLMVMPAFEATLPRINRREERWKVLLFVYPFRILFPSRQSTVCLRDGLRRINCIFIFEFFQAPRYLGVVVDLHAKIQISSCSSSMKKITLKLKLCIEDYYGKKFFYCRLFCFKHVLINVVLFETILNI